MLRRSRFIAFTAIAGLSAVLIAATSVTPTAQKSKRLRGPATPTAERLIEGGTFEASGVVSVAGTDGVLFVDDGRDDVVFWMRVDSDGRQLDQAVAIPLGVRVGDLEGITTDGTWYYAVGSQSKAEFVEGPGLVRFRFDPETRRIDRAESVSGLRRRLLSLLPSVAKAAGPREDGFNIEGLAWDHASKRLLLGLRSPVIDGHAIVLPLDVGDPQSRLASLDRLNVSETDIVRLPLDNAGIRSMEYDARAGGFLVVAASSGSAPFRVWKWTGGSSGSSQLAVHASFAARLKPEGITPLHGQRAFTLIVFDTSRYVAVP
jgi:Protein of unknown function (DUF3616)